MRKVWAISWVVVCSACSSPSTSGAPSASTVAGPASASGSAAAAASASGAPVTPATVAANNDARPAVTETAPTASEAPPVEAAVKPAPVAWSCGSQDGAFENVGDYHGAVDLYAPKSEDELPAPFAWSPCAGGGAGCNTLGVHANSAAFDFDTPRGPVLLVAGQSGGCGYVLTIDPDGKVLTAIELRAHQGITIGPVVAAQGAYDVKVKANNEPKAPLEGWFNGSAMRPPATALADHAGDVANDAISDRLWLNSGLGAFGLLGSAKNKATFATKPDAYAVVHGSVLGLRRSEGKIVIHDGSNETDVVAAAAGHELRGMDASAKTIAWVEAEGSKCTLSTSPFQLTPLGRSAPLKPKVVGDVPCEGAETVRIGRKWVRVGKTLVRDDGSSIAVPGGGTFLGAADGFGFAFDGGQVQRFDLAVK